jgi:tetratricopeptide (TPR) repeat protein
MSGARDQETGQEEAEAQVEERGAATDEEGPRRRFLVPQERNPLFTGREDVLAALEAALHAERAAGITPATADLGGVGKSQAALEYAYRHREEYRFVFWVQAESEATLNRDFGEIARRLELAVREAAETEAVREGVKQWLAEHDDYLLILDDADTPAAAAAYLPAALRGHRLVSSRATDLGALGIQRVVMLPELTEDEAIGLLRKRTGRGEAPVEWSTAGELARQCGCLPLVLELAGSYIAAQKIGFDEYLARLWRRRWGILERERPEWGATERTVHGVWEASFEAVRAENRAAAELLTVSAFFAAERIPYALLQRGARELGNWLAAAVSGADERRLEETLAVLERYRLVRRDAESRSYSVHRVIQAMVRAPRRRWSKGSGLTPGERRRWMHRAVRAVDRALPAASPETLPACEQILPHGLAAAAWIEQERVESEGAVFLLNRMSDYLWTRGQTRAAETLLQRAPALAGSGPAPAYTANSLIRLAEMYRDQGKLAEAEPLYRQALNLRWEALGSEHPDTLRSLEAVAALYLDQGRLADVEPFYRGALAIRERMQGGESVSTARSLSHLAMVYHLQGRLAEAEALLRRALAIREWLHGADHLGTAAALHDLGMLFRSQGRLAEAEPLVRRGLAIRERELGAEHPELASSLHGLGLLSETQGKLAEAETCLLRALAIWELRLGRKHPSTANGQCSLAELHRIQGRFAEAEPLLQGALAIREQALGTEHYHTAGAWWGLAELHREQGRWTEAEPLLERALATWERTLGGSHSVTAAGLNSLGLLYQAQGKLTEAEQPLQRALAIREQALGAEHYATAESLSNLALLYREQGKRAEAEPLQQRALGIFERALGPEHPNTVRCREKLAELRAERGGK